MFGLEDHRHAVMDMNDARRCRLGEQGAGKHLSAVLSFPDGPKSGKGDCIRIQCGDVVGLLPLPARVAPDQLLFIPLVPSACRHQAAQPAQAVTPGRLLRRLFGPGIEGQGGRRILLPPMGNKPPTRAVQFQQSIVGPEDHGHTGCRSHIEAWLRPMPIPSVDFQDMGNSCFVWKGESSAHGYLVRLGSAEAVSADDCKNRPAP